MPFGFCCWPSSGSSRRQNKQRKLQKRESVLPPINVIPEKAIQDTSDYTYTASSHSSTRTSRVSSAHSVQPRYISSGNKATVGSNSPYHSTSIKLSACRWCSKKFEYKFEDGSGFVTVLPGIPPKDEAYSAVSHLWGDGPGSSLDLSCLKCKNITTVSTSAAKLHLIMKLAKPGASIWWDVLSIDQSNQTEVSETISAMGTIYGMAKSVLVLLPSSDESAYQNLARIARASTILLSFRHAFEENEEQTLIRSSTGEPLTLGSLSEEFWKLISAFDASLNQHTYFSRAWTVQEWSIAQDLDVAFENTHLILPGTSYETLEGVKSAVREAAEMLIKYKRKHQRMSRIVFNLSRRQVLSNYDAVNRLFPQPEAIPSHPSDAAEESSRLDPKDSHHDLSKLSHPYPDYPSLSPFAHENASAISLALSAYSSTASFVTRLTSTLSAYHLTDQHHTRYPADLVASWASMTNLNYDYSSADSFAFALQKALTAIRRQGVKVWNWNVNTWGAECEVDLSMLEYGGVVAPCNRLDGACEIEAPPMLSGVAETVHHLKQAVRNVEKYGEVDVAAASSSESGHSGISNSNTAAHGERPHLLGLGVGLGPVKGATKIVSVTALSSAAAQREFQKAVYGDYDIRDGFGDVAGKVEEALRSMSPVSKEQCSLVLAKVPAMKFEQNDEKLEVEGIKKGGNMYAWTIIPAGIEEGNLIVAREDLNGTLVVVRTREETKKGTKSISGEVLGYLTVTEQRTGTWLVRGDRS
jgi:hypothetical protein